MTKIEFVQLLQQRLNDETLSQKTLIEILNTGFDLIREMTIEYGEKIYFKPFGVFSAKEYEERPARDPRTQEKIMAKARTKVKFNPGDASVKVYE